MKMSESIKQQIKELLSDIVLISKTEQRASKRDNIEALLDRLMEEVKKEEETRARQIIDEERRAMKQELREAEARQILVDAVSKAVTDHLESLGLQSALQKIVTQSLLKKNIDNRVDVRLEEFINRIKSQEKRDFLPGGEDFIDMYKRLPEEVREKMPIYLVTRKCRELLNLPFPESARELEKMQMDIREALSEVQRWKVNVFVHISDLETAMTLQAQSIDEELSKAGFPRLSRRMSEGQETISFYIPVEPSRMDEVKIMEEKLMEKTREISARLGKQIVESIGTEQRKVFQELAKEDMKRRELMRER